MSSRTGNHHPPSFDMTTMRMILLISEYVWKVEMQC